MDGARDQVMGELNKTCNDASVEVQKLEFSTPWENLAEGSVRKNKQALRRAIKKSSFPLKL